MEKREVRQTKEIKEIQPKRYLHQCHHQYYYHPSTSNLYYYCCYHDRHCLLSNYCVLGIVAVLYVHSLFLKTTQHSQFYRRGNWHTEHLAHLLEATELICLTSGYVLCTTLSFSWLENPLSWLCMLVTPHRWPCEGVTETLTAWLFKLTFSHIGQLMILYCWEGVFMIHLWNEVNEPVLSSRGPSVTAEREAGRAEPVTGAGLLWTHAQKAKACLRTFSVQGCKSTFKKQKPTQHFCICSFTLDYLN